MKVKRKAFKLFVNQFSLDHERTWAVGGRGALGGTWRTARVVECYVPLVSVFSPGRYARKQQPFAWFKGVGVVRREGDRLIIE